MDRLGAGLVATPGASLAWSAFTALITAGAVSLAYSAYVRLVEKRPVSELSLDGAWRELGAGIALGAGMLAGTVGILWLLGHYRVTGVNGLGFVAAPLIAAVSASVTEEIIFRGVVFRLIERGLGSWLAIAFSALLFGLGHAANPNATWFSSVAVALEAGILLAAAYMLTRRLWLAIGVHFAWNLVQGGIFGVAVSGLQASGLLRSLLTGPEWLSGGEFGVEASVVAVVVCVATGVYLLLKAKARGHIVSPFWSRRR
jgi:membrane protease YdiL (CAAX protease family)